MKPRLAILLILLIAGRAGAQGLFVTTAELPTNTVAPAVTGDTDVGSTLSVGDGTYSNTVITLRKQWRKNGSTITGETGATYDTSSDQAGDVITCQEIAVSGAGATYTLSNSVILTDTGNASIESATIDSTGTTLTVVLTGSDTITNATGWSLVFDNYAERTLTYDSGSGTDTFVFDITANATYTDADTDNDAAPVGTVVTMNYDADTGNVGTLADAGGVSVTNNSTAIPDPDLPEQVDTSLPDNWDDAADYTPADNAALQALVTGGGLAGKVVELTAGTDYGYIDWSSLAGGASAAAPTIIRTSEWDNVNWPAYGERLPATIDGNPHTDYMPTISRTITSQEQVLAVMPSGLENVRFIGINWESRGTYTGNYYTTIEMFSPCSNLIFDRCRFWWQDELKPVQGWAVANAAATNLAVIDSRFENYYGSTSDNSPTWIYDGKKILVHGNYMQCMSNGCFTADNGARVVEDVTISENHITRPTDWSTGHGTQKAGGYESKGGKRLWVTRNRIENIFSDSWQGIIIKAEHADNRSVQCTINWNKITSQGNGCGITHHVNGSLGLGGPNTDALIEHNLIYDVAFRSLVLSGKADYARVKILHNTFPQNNLAEYSHFNFDGSAASQHLVCRDNIVRGYGASVGGAFQGSGAIGFNSSWSSGLYSATYNIFFDASASNYDSDTSPTPEGTLANNAFPAFASVGFADAGNDDYTLTPGSTYSATGGSPASDATDRGADVSTLNTIMTGVEE